MNHYHKILFLFLVFQSLNIYSESNDINISQECLKNPMFGHFYRQQNYQIESHQGDLIMASLGNRYSETLLSTLKLKKINEEKRQLDMAWIRENCSPFIQNANEISDQFNDLLMSEADRAESEKCRLEKNHDNFNQLECELGKVIRKSPVNVKEYTKNFKAVMREYEKESGKKIYRSKEHHWSKKNKKELLKKFPAAVVIPKLLAGLALGATSRFMMTPQDAVLRTWISAQPMSSLMPEDLLKKSLELQDGDIYKALLSIENVLSEFWLFADREQIRQTASLHIITNTCDPKSEDVFGSWYHLFGTMLLGCVKGPIISTIIGKTESLGGRVLDLKSAKKKGHNLAYHMIFGTDPQEEKINARGGKIGHRICNGIPKRK